MQKKIQVLYCLKSYLERLHRLSENARDSFDANCPSCKGTGKSRTLLNILGQNKIMTVSCDCFKSNKTKITQRILDVNKLLDRYYSLFNKCDDELTFKSYASKYGSKIINILTKYLENNMPSSLLLSGESGSGKTTILKMLWQILLLNNRNVYYLKCAEFEAHYHNFYTDKSSVLKIQNMINASKQADYILLDEHLIQISKNALAGYYEIFDYARANKKTLIMASNKSYAEIIKTYNEK